MEDRRYWIKYRWEFLRRNKEYQSDYLMLKSKDNPSRYAALEAFYNKWGISMVLDPDKSFEELIHCKDDDPKIQRWVSMYFESGIDQQAVAWYYPYAPPSGEVMSPDRREEIEKTLRWIDENLERKKKIIKLSDGNSVEVIEQGGTTTYSPQHNDCVITSTAYRSSRSILRIEIDFSRVNSIPKLKKEISNRIDLEVGRHLDDEEKLNKTDYDIILKVGDLNRRGLKDKDIARKLFPEHFDINNYDARPESIIRNMNRLNARYEELVNGGFKKLTIP